MINIYNRNAIRTAFAVLFTMLLPLTADAEITTYKGCFKNISGTPYGVNANESYLKLLDGDYNRKWCAGLNSNNNESTWEITFETEDDNGIGITSYVLVPANDAYMYSNRNPKTWTLYAQGKDGDPTADEKWQEIAHVDNGNSYLGSLARAEYKFNLKVGTYKYFKFIVTQVQGVDYNFPQSDMMQLAELFFYGNRQELVDHTEQITTQTTYSKRYEVPENSYHVINIDGVTLTAEQGIRVPRSSVLEINGPGKLIAHGFRGQAAIGGNAGEDCGMIIINSAWVEALVDETQGRAAAGIGGGNDGNGGSITINGGYVKAVGDTDGAGIGGGGKYASKGGDGGSVTINNATVIAIGGLDGNTATGYGIGPGKNPTNDSQGADAVLTVNSRRITTEANWYYCYHGTTNFTSDLFDLRLYTVPKTDMTLLGRTFYKDGQWNTICLPFPLDVSDTAENPLAGATVRTLTDTGFDSSTGTLTLNFTPESTTISSGVPYIIKWDSDNENPVIENPTIRVEAILENTINSFGDETQDCVSFKGSFDPLAVTADDKSILFLGNNNTLYYPTADMIFGAFRGYFKLNEHNPAGQAAAQNGIKAFKLSFDDEATGIVSTKSLDGNTSDSKWFDLSGREVANGKSANRKSPPGIYIVRMTQDNASHRKIGKKVLLK